MYQGSTQITSVDQNGRNYVATVNQGDLWYFPPGVPHSLQATNDSSEGTEFLLVRSWSWSDLTQSADMANHHPRSSPMEISTMTAPSW